LSRMVHQRANRAAHGRMGQDTTNLVSLLLGLPGWDTHLWANRSTVSVPGATAVPCQTPRHVGPGQAVGRTHSRIQIHRRDAVSTLRRRASIRVGALCRFTTSQPDPNPELDHWLWPSLPQASHPCPHARQPATHKHTHKHVYTQVGAHTRNDNLHCSRSREAVLKTGRTSAALTAHCASRALLGCRDGHSIALLR